MKTAYKNRKWNEDRILDRHRSESPVHIGPTLKKIRISKVAGWQTQIIGEIFKQLQTKVPQNSYLFFAKCNIFVALYIFRLLFIVKQLWETVEF